MVVDIFKVEKLYGRDFFNFEYINCYIDGILGNG